MPGLNGLSETSGVARTLASQELPGASRIQGTKRIARILSALCVCALLTGGLPSSAEDGSVMPRERIVSFQGAARELASLDDRIELRSRLAKINENALEIASRKRAAADAYWEVKTGIGALRKNPEKLSGEALLSLKNLAVQLRTVREAIMEKSAEARESRRRMRSARVAGEWPASLAEAGALIDAQGELISLLADSQALLQTSLALTAH